MEYVNDGRSRVNRTPGEASGSPEHAKPRGWVSVQEHVLPGTVCGPVGQVPRTVGQKASQGRSPGGESTAGSPSVNFVGCLVRVPKER